MSTALAPLAPQTLLRDRDDGSVLSARERVLRESDARNRGVEGIFDASPAIRAKVESGELEVVAANTEPSIPTCLQCGCTDNYSCTGGCSWASNSLCTSCAWAMRSREEIEADTNAAFGCVVRENEAVARLLVIHGELLLDIRDLLAAPVDAVDPRLEILERIAARADRRIVTAGADVLR